MTGRNRLFFLTIVALGTALPACTTRGVPRPIPERAKVRIPSSAIDGAVSLPRHNDPLAESATLEQSGTVRMIDGRAPVGPHMSAAFTARAAAHERERYVHTLTARANGRRNIPAFAAPAAPPPMAVPFDGPVATATAAAPAIGRTPVSFRPHDVVPVTRPSTTVATPWTAPPVRPAVTPPSYVRPAAPTFSTPAAPVGTPPGGSSSFVSAPVISTPVVTAPANTAPFSLASVPAHLRDLNALQAMEARLADQSISISMERRAVLRVATAIREHQTRNSSGTREKLDEAFREYQQGATAGRGLSLSSGAQAFAAAEPAVRSRLDVVNGERKAVTRLIVALRLYQQSPSADNGLAIAQAVEKYNRR